MNRHAASDLEPKRPALCRHSPACPSADAVDREAAHTVAFHPEQGWSLLCNGIVVFEDNGEILPDGRLIPPHRPSDNLIVRTAA
jgi:hypothetical protein